ncbi:hypothetical protein AOLI_G00256590 [Acnodon oligacanthus]
MEKERACLFPDSLTLDGRGSQRKSSSPVWRGNETKPPSIKVSWSRTSHSKAGSKESDTAIRKQTARYFVFLRQDDLFRE